MPYAAYAKACERVRPYDEFALGAGNQNVEAFLFEENAQSYCTVAFSSKGRMAFANAEAGPANFPNKPRISSAPNRLSE